MIKQLLSVAVMAGFALAASAAIPMPIKHNNAWLGSIEEGNAYSDGNGMQYNPSTSGSIAEALDPNYIIHCVADVNGNNKLNDPGSGFQWQTASIKATNKSDFGVTNDHIIFAFDYKTNKTCRRWDMYVIYAGNFIGGGDLFIREGVHTTPSDEWQTLLVYFPIQGTYLAGNNAYGRPADWGLFNDESHTGSDYLWVRAADLKCSSDPDFWMDIKQPRMLTLEEAETIVKEQLKEGDQEVVIGSTAPNGDIAIDMGDEGELYFTTQGENPLANLYNPAVGLHPKNTVFKVDYQVLGEGDQEEYPFVIHLMNCVSQFGGYLPSGQAAVAKMDAKYELDEEEWGTVEVDFAEQIPNTGYCAGAHQNGLWFQLRPDQNFPTGTLFKLKNARWTAPATSGIEDLNADNADAPVVYYNLQGVQVANPANGLYIKKQGNTTSKVLVK